MNLLIKFPSRGRREKFFSTLQKYQEHITELGTKFIITLDEDDSEMNNPEVLNKLATYKNVKVVLGTSESKIHAVNRDIDINDDWDILLLASDDMIPQIIGFDKVIITLMKQSYPDTDGILFFNDGFQGSKLNTLSILGKKYYQRFNYIYHPDYKSTWCDNEFTLVGNILKKQTYFPLVLIKHEHPDWGYGSMDKIHQLNHKNLSYDHNLFLTRQKNNFYL